MATKKSVTANSNQNLEETGTPNLPAESSAGTLESNQDGPNTEINDSDGDDEPGKSTLADSLGRVEVKWGKVLKYAGYGLAALGVYLVVRKIMKSRNQTPVGAQDESSGVIQTERPDYREV